LHLHRFGAIADFLRSRVTPRTPIPPQFWGVLVAPDRPCWGQPAEAIRPPVKLFSKNSNLWSRRHGT